MEDNYSFLKEENLDELYKYVQEVENLYKKGIYKQIPQECRKTLELIIEDLCKYNNVETEPYDTLYKKAKKVQRCISNEGFWDDFYEIKNKGNCASHYRKDIQITKNEAVRLLKIFYRFVCDYFAITHGEEITLSYQLPEQEKNIEEKIKSYIDSKLSNHYESQNDEEKFVNLNNRIQELERQNAVVNEKYTKAVDNFENKQKELIDSIQNLMKPTQSKIVKKTSRIEKYLHDAQQNYNYKNYQEAVENWYKVLKLEPNYDLDYFLLASAERETKRYNTAIEHFSIYIKKNPKSIYLAQAYNKRGWCYEQLESYKEAQADYDKAYELNPKINNTKRLEKKLKNSGIADITVELSNELLLGYKSKNVPELLQKINFQQDNDIPKYGKNELASIYHDKRANEYYENEEFEAALEEWNIVLQSDKNFAIDYLRLAISEDEIGEYDVALEYYEKFIENNPNSENLIIAYNKRGYIYEQLEEYIEAKENYNKSINIEPNNEYASRGLKRIEQKIKDMNKNNPSHYNNLAEAFYKNEQYQEAVADWNRVLELDSGYGIDYFRFAYATNAIGDYDKALELYSISINNNPNDDASYNNRGLIWKKKKEYARAIEDYSKAIELDCSDPLYYNNRAKTFYECEQYKEAVDDWNKVLELDSDYGVDYFRFAYATDEIGDYDKALELYSISINNNPNSYASYNNRGLIWKKKKEYARAIEDYSKAIELNCNKPLYYNNRAEAFYECEQYQEAVDDWNKVLELDSGYEINYIELAFAENEIGNFNNALKYYNYSSGESYGIEDYDDVFTVLQAYMIAEKYGLDAEEAVDLVKRLYKSIQKLK